MRQIAWALLGTHPPTRSDPREARTLSMHRMCSRAATSWGVPPQVRGLWQGGVRATFVGAACVCVCVSRPEYTAQTTSTSPTPVSSNTQTQTQLPASPA
eukprot:6888912-Prymnesium_polylepis.1